MGKAWVIPLYFRNWKASLTDKQWSRQKLLWNHESHYHFPYSVSWLFVWECKGTPVSKHSPTCTWPIVLPFELSNVNTLGTQIWWSRDCWEVSRKLQLIFQHLLPEGAVQEIKINEPCPRKAALAFEIHFNSRDRRKHLKDPKGILLACFRNLFPLKLNPICISWIIFIPLLCI